MLILSRKLNKKQVMIALICMVFIVLQVWLDLKIPDYMSEITKLVQTEGSQINSILEQGMFMLLCAIGSMAFSIIVGYLASYIAASFSKTIRKNVFDKVQRFGLEEIKLFSTSSLITRTTNDITQVQMLIAMGLQVIVKAPIMTIWAIYKIAGKSTELTWFTGATVIFLVFMIIILMFLLIPKFKIIQTLTDNLNRIARENLTGIRVVRAYNAENYQQEKFETANIKLTNTNLFTNRIMAIMSPIMGFTMSGLSLGVYWIGAYLISNANRVDKLDLFSNIVVFSSYAMQVIMGFMMLIIIFMIYPRASVSAKRIVEVLNTKEKIKDGNVEKEKGKTRGKIEFKNVSFKYPNGNDYVLKDISFTVNPGETIAFIGATGCGKTSLINLIPRIYDVTKGQVLIDEIDVKKYKKEFLNNKISYIPQQSILFSGTIKSNICYGKSKNGKPLEDDVKEAIRISQAEEFVSKQENGYDAHVAQGGSNYSGGQKQRLQIARAISRKPDIYIFDDSFSALDYKTDSVLRKELTNYTKESTKVIVAQRIGTIKNANKIIVLDNGQIVGMGTHKELLKSCNVYKEIALSQLSEEELASEG